MQTTATNDSGHVAGGRADLTPVLKPIAYTFEDLLSTIENNDLHCREALKVALSELKHLYGTGRTTQQAEVLGTIMQAIAILTESAKELAASAAQSGISLQLPLNK